MKRNKSIILNKKPDDKLTRDCFRVVEDKVQLPCSGELLIKVKLISIDAANRAWIQGATYRPVVSVGEIMPAYGVGEVISCNSDKFAKGDLVIGELNWAEYITRSARFLTKATKTKDLISLLTYAGIAGLTAFHGLIDTSKINKNDTILISTAAGSVGMFACQIAKLLGCKVIGLSGTTEKCEWVERELGVDNCFNYKDLTLLENLKEICPDGFDVYFDNVGGSLLEKVLYCLKMKGRVTCCGAISQYDAKSITSPRNISGVIITKRLKIEGFLVTDFYGKRDEATNILSKWYQSGAIKVFTEEYSGLESAPEALINLLQGKNLGKTIVQL